MGRIFKKIRNRSGETIGETLIALLVASLALVMLAGAIATSSGIITRSANTINKYYDTNESVVMMNGAENGAVTLTGSGSTTGLSQTVDVKYKVNSEINSKKPVTAFMPKEPASAEAGSSGTNTSELTGSGQ